MTEEILFLIFFIAFSGVLLAAAGTNRLTGRIKYRRAQREWLRDAEERKWRAEFFERYRRETAEEDKP